MVARLFSDTQELEISHEYAGGSSLRTLARIHNCSTLTIRHAIGRAGGHVRPSGPNGRRSSLDWDDPIARAAYFWKKRSLRVAFVDAARADGCVDCGNKNLTVLHSDHVRGKKFSNVSVMGTTPLWRLFEELAKCETRCANCHMIATAGRRKVVFA